MLILILSILFLASKTQIYMSLYPSFQQKIIKSYANLLAKDLTGECLEMNIKQKMIKKCDRSVYIYFFQSNIIDVDRFVCFGSFKRWW